MTWFRNWAAIAAIGALAIGVDGCQAATPSVVQRQMGALETTIQRSLNVMRAVRSVHAVGTDLERQVDDHDANSTGSWHITADCANHDGMTVSRMRLNGHVTGSHPRAVDMQYIVAVPTAIDWSNYVPWLQRWHVWARPTHSTRSWTRTSATHDAMLVMSLCPALVAQQVAPQLTTPIRDLGKIRVRGHPTRRLEVGYNGHGGGFTAAMYIDLTSYRWPRIELSGWGAGCCHTFDTTVGYSRFNVPVHISVPRRTS